MKKLRSLFVPGLMLLTIGARSQDMIEAFNLSNLSAQGTARSIGFGGALGSVGGDFSALSVNPAGLGVYRSSELSFTPSIRVNGSSSDFLGSTNTDIGARITINNFGVVFTDAPKGKRYERRSWKAMSFAIGMNRVADYNRNYTYSGNNNTSSASLAFEANGNADSNNVTDIGSLAYMGDYTGLIVPGTTRNSYLTAVPFAGGIRQMNTVSEKGSAREYVLSLGGNYMEKLMLGVTLGIPTFKYQRTSDYTETLLPGNTAHNPWDFQSFNYNNKLTITGTGINLKLGAIYRLSDFFRVGAAIHTPTLYGIADQMEYGLTTLMEGLPYSVSTNDMMSPTRFDYSFLTPMRSVLSATFILKKYGFITADYEFVNYSTMKFIYPAGMDGMYSFAYEQQLMNDAIKQRYTSASNLRLGAEIKVMKNLMVRWGMGIYGSPCKDPAEQAERVDISLGVGYRNSTFFADFALLNSTTNFKEPAYNEIDYYNVITPTNPVAAPVANVSANATNLVFSIGVKF